MNLQHTSLRTFLCLLAVTATGQQLLSAETPPTSSSGVHDSSKPVCVAVIEPEVLADLPQAERSALAGSLDTLLTESLAKQNGFTLVDRQALDKVLAEKSLRKLDIQTADARLKPFIAAGVIICPTVVADAKSGNARVIVQAVLAQRGLLLAEMTATVPVEETGWKDPPAIQQPMEQLWKDVGQQLETNLQLPSLEVCHINLPGKLDRLQWMADDLTDALAATRCNGLVLLVPRQPIHTKEERLLRLMGLSSPDDGDRSAKVSAPSDFRLAGDLREDVKPGVPFDQTPIEIELRLTGGGKQLATTQLIGVVSEYDMLRKQALAWAGEQLAKVLPVRHESSDESHAKALAQQELVTVWRLAAISYGSGTMERSRRERLAMAALRACHLDPANEEAAFQVVQTIDGLYDARERRHTLACWDRLLVEAHKYLDRFGDRFPEHHCQVLEQMSNAGFRSSGFLTGGSTGSNDILATPDALRFKYVREYVVANFDMGIRGQSNKMYDRGNGLSAMQSHIRLHLIPNIPDDKLEDEYRFWREFWDKYLVPLGEDKCLPWDCIEMAFSARRKDCQGVRDAAIRLATKYPKSNSNIWRLQADDTVTLYLHAAGDKEWETWQPDSTKPRSSEINIYLTQAFYRDCRPPMPTVWDYSRATALPGVRIVFAEGIVKIGMHNDIVEFPKVECFMVAGEQAWFVSPRLWDNRWRPHHLFVAPVSALLGKEKVKASLTEIPWPPTPDPSHSISPDSSVLAFVTCWHVTAAPDGHVKVWIGTGDHGLARFEKNDGRWIGQWYTSRQGMPSERISSITSFRRGKQHKLLIVGGGPRDQPGRRLFIWTLDVQSEKIQVLSNIEAANCMGFLTAVWPDGRKVPLSIWNETDYGDLDLEQAREFVPVGQAFPDSYVDGIDLRVTRAEGKERLWGIRYGKHSAIQEMSPSHLETLESPAIKGPKTSYDDPTPRRFWEFAWHDVVEGMPSDAPLDEVCSTQAVGQDIWMIVRPYQHMQERGQGTHLLLYRPAPQGDKDWASHDLWIGPFTAPADATLFRMTADNAGGLWITATDSVYRIDAKTLLDHAEKNRLTATTEQWRQYLDNRIRQAEWPVRFRVLIARAQFAQAMELVERQLDSLGAVDRTSPYHRRELWSQAMLRKAFSLGCLEQWDGSLATYRQIRESMASVELAREFAARETLWLLVAAQRREELLKEVDAQGLVFDDLDILTRYVQQARETLGKSGVAPPNAKDKQR